MPVLQIRHHRGPVLDVSIFVANRAVAQASVRDGGSGVPTRGHRRGRARPQPPSASSIAVSSAPTPFTVVVSTRCFSSIVGHGLRQWLMLPVQFGRFPRWLPASCPRRVMAFPPRHDARDAEATIAHLRQRAARPPAARTSVGEPSPWSRLSCTVLPGRTVGRAHRPNARSVHVHSAATRGAPHITMPSPSHIPLACRAPQSECGRTPPARGHHKEEEPRP